MCIHKRHFHQAWNEYFETLKFIRILWAAACLFALLLYISLLIAIIICCEKQSFVDSNINMYRISRDKAVMWSQGSGWHVLVCLILIVRFHYQLLPFSYSGFILRNTGRGTVSDFNPLNPELNPICYLLALLGAHHFLHVSRTRVKSLTFRRLMSYIYGAPILDVSRSHTTTQHSR